MSDAIIPEELKKKLMYIIEHDFFTETDFWWRIGCEQHPFPYRELVIAPEDVDRITQLIVKAVKSAELDLLQDIEEEPEKERSKGEAPAEKVREVVAQAEKEKKTTKFKIGDHCLCRHPDAYRGEKPFTIIGITILHLKNLEPRLCYIVSYDLDKFMDAIPVKNGGGYEMEACDETEAQEKEA